MIKNPLVRNVIVSMFAVVASLMGLYLVWKLVGSGGTSSSATVQTITIEEDDQVKGKKDSSIILVEYSDFQCPACGAFFPIVSQVVDQYKDKLAFVYRHYPLPQHKNARMAALAAEAAGDQGKFWEMHDRLFEAQKDWSESKEVQKQFESYAKELKLDLKKYQQSLKKPQLQDVIDRDISSGNTYGVNSTPTFYLNGRKLQNVRSIEDFSREIDKLLK